MKGAAEERSLLMVKLHLTQATPLEFNKPKNKQTFIHKF